MGSDLYTKILIKFSPHLIDYKLTGSSCEQQGCFLAKRGNKPDNAKGSPVQLANHCKHAWIRDCSFLSSNSATEPSKEKAQQCQCTAAALLHKSCMLQAKGRGNWPFLTTLSRSGTWMEEGQSYWPQSSWEEWKKKNLSSPPSVVTLTPRDLWLKARFHYKRDAVGLFLSLQWIFKAGLCWVFFYTAVFMTSGTASVEQ